MCSLQRRVSDQFTDEDLDEMVNGLKAMLAETMRKAGMFRLALTRRSFRRNPE